MGEQIRELVDRANYFPLVQIQVNARISREAMARLGDEGIAELRDRLMERLREPSAHFAVKVSTMAHLAVEVRQRMGVDLAAPAVLEVDAEIHGWLAPIVRVLG